MHEHEALEFWINQGVKQGAKIVGITSNEIAAYLQYYKIFLLNRKACAMHSSSRAKKKEKLFSHLFKYVIVSGLGIRTAFCPTKTNAAILKRKR
jgi:hypothetical protein